MIEMTKDFVRGITYLEYPKHIGQGELVSRQDVAARMGVTYNTAVYHLERCVTDGLLHKQYGFIGKQPGWLYSLPYNETEN